MNYTNKQTAAIFTKDHSFLTYGQTVVIIDVYDSMYLIRAHGDSEHYVVRRDQLFFAI